MFCLRAGQAGSGPVDRVPGSVPDVLPARRAGRQRAIKNPGGNPPGCGARAAGPV